MRVTLVVDMGRPTGDYRKCGRVCHRIVRPGTALGGLGVDTVHVRCGPESEHEREWFKMLALKVKPGGRIFTFTGETKVYTPEDWLTNGYKVFDA